MTSITVTRLARNLTDIVNRIVYRGEHFVVTRGNREVARMVPPPAGRPLSELAEVLAGLPPLEPDESAAFRREIDEARQAMGGAGEGPWES